MWKYSVAFLCLLTGTAAGAFGASYTGIITEVTSERITIARNDDTMSFRFSIELLTDTGEFELPRSANPKIIDLKKGDKVTLEGVGRVDDLVCTHFYSVKPAGQADSKKDKAK